MNTNEPQYETMPEHYVLCFNNECVKRMQEIMNNKHKKCRKTVSILKNCKNHAKFRNKMCLY